MTSNEGKPTQEAMEAACEWLKNQPGSKYLLYDGIYTSLALLLDSHAAKEREGRRIAVHDLLERIKGTHPCGTCGHQRREHAMDLVGDHFCETDGCKCENYVGVFAPSYAELVAALEKAVNG